MHAAPVDAASRDAGTARTLRWGRGFYGHRARVMRASLVPLVLCGASLWPNGHNAQPVLATSGLTWNTSLTVGPIALARPATAVGQDGNVYVFGGTLGNNTDYNTTYIYQSGTNSWSLGAGMPIAREGAQAITLPDGRIVVLGGGSGCAYSNLCDSGTVYNEVDAYTPSTNSWATLAPMLNPRYRFAAVLYHGEIYAIGGSDGTQATASVEAYDPNANNWSYVASLPLATEAAAAAVDANDHIDVAGGFDGTDSSPEYNTLYSFDGNQWTSGPSLPQATEDAGATIGADGQLYIVGGFDAGWLTTVQAYNPSTAAWSFVTSLPSATCCSGTLTLPNGQMYVVAGGDSAGSQVAIYGPSTSLSSSAGPAGSTTTLSGSGFAPSANVSVYWGSPATDILLGTGTTDADGALIGQIAITVPDSAAAGTYTVTAVDDQSQYPAFTSFTVPAAGSSIASLIPTSGSYQQTVKVAGAYFKPGEQVSLFWDSLGPMPLAIATAGASGVVNTTFVIPQSPSGSHILIAVGHISHARASALVQVWPKAVLYHTSSVAGSRNAIAGYGLAPNETVNIYWGSAPQGGILLGSATTNSKGTFSGSSALIFSVPRRSPGPYNVVAIGQSNGGVSILTVTP